VVDRIKEYASRAVRRQETSPITRVQRHRDELAKAWILEIIDRTPLEEVDGLELGWLAREAPPLIADILGALADPGLAGEVAVEPAGAARAAELGRLRRGGEAAAAQVPRDLGALHALLIEALRREAGRPVAPEFARTVERLAEVIGEVQATVAEGLVRERSGGAARDPLTGLPGPAELDEWLRVMLSTERRYGTPFSLLLLDVEGLARVNEAHGREAGDRALAGVAAIVAEYSRALGPAFRIGEDELCVLLSHQGPIPAAPIAERIVALVTASQTSNGAGVDVAIGIASCPDHGRDASSLLARAEEASYEAKAAGKRVAVAPPAPAKVQGG
jgi:diguanylate cyclase (GGDEF)-like protein